jgi:hypothetical protein
MQQLSGSAGRGGTATPLIVFHVASGETWCSYPLPSMEPKRRAARSSFVISPDRTNVGREDDTGAGREATGEESRDS